MGSSGSSGSSEPSGASRGLGEDGPVESFLVAFLVLGCLEVSWEYQQRDVNSKKYTRLHNFEMCQTKP